MEIFFVGVSCWVLCCGGFDGDVVIDFNVGNFCCVEIFDNFVDIVVGVLEVYCIVVVMDGCV